MSLYCFKWMDDCQLSFLRKERLYFDVLSVLFLSPSFLLSRTHHLGWVPSWGSHFSRRARACGRDCSQLHLFQHGVGKRIWWKEAKEQGLGRKEYVLDLLDRVFAHT